MTIQNMLRNILCVREPREWFNYGMKREKSVPISSTQMLSLLRTAGQAAHNHSKQVGAYTAAKIISTVQRKAVTDIFKPASTIVDKV